jgi:hydroxymethylpyrimidine/phosphomethylpyrimidine kinase
VTADIKTIAAHECFGVSCITALTVQSTKGVRRVEPVDPGIITATLEELASDLEIASVHLGMLGTAGAATAVADFLAKARLPHVVLDPVLKSTSGADLLDAAGLQALVERLIPLADVITPNLAEAELLTGQPVANLEQIGAAAARLHSMGAANVVITGGDMDKATDFLSFRTSSGFEVEVFRSERLRSNSTHGTGCAFSTAVACQLALGRSMPEATLLSKAYVSAAIVNALALGRGIGPVNHLYRMNRSRRAGIAHAEPETAPHRN